MVSIYIQMVCIFIYPIFVESVPESLESEHPEPKHQGIALFNKNIDILLIQLHRSW
jgi:hypothetical protein